MFSPAASNDPWVAWLLIALLLAPFVLLAFLGRPQAVLWTCAAMFGLFILGIAFVTEWLFFAFPIVILGGFSVTTLCYFAAKLSRDKLWRRPSDQKDKI